MTPIARLTPLLLATLLLTAGVARAAKEPVPEPGLIETDQGIFIDTLNVAVVNVDVYVTDKKGNRITGLGRDDFELYENGRPVAITHFASVEAGSIVRRQVLAEAGSPAVEEAEEAEEAVSDLPEDQRLHLVVYIDNFNIQPFNRNRVMRELRDFLRHKLDTEDRVMLISYDRELHLRHPWTSDPAVVASALQDLETLSGHAVHRESDRRDALQRIEEAESPQEALSYATTYAGSIFNDLSFSIDALRDAVSGLAGMPGRKAILYVSEGIPMIAGEDLFHAVNQKFSDYSALTQAFEYDASRRFQELTAAANANRVTFYTIDAAGLRTYSYSDASRQGPGQGAMVEQVYIANLQNPLQMIAEQTGGKAIINRNRVTEALDEVADDFDTYYSLGYTPSHFGDGRYYRLEVKLVKDKAKRRVVRHREGYRDKPMETRMSDGTMSALLHDFVNNPLGVRLDFGAAALDDKGLYMVPLRVAIPLGKVVLVPASQSHEARLRAWVAVMDERGGLSEMQALEVPISIPTPELEGAREQLYLYTMNLLMRGGPHRVAVGIRDDVGAEASFVLGRVNVGVQ